MKRQPKNSWKNRFRSFFTNQKRRRPGNRNILCLESLEKRQMLSGVPWLPTGIAEAPIAEAAASVPAAEVAEAADAAAAKVPGKESPEAMKATVTPDAASATPPADGEALDTEPAGVNEENNRADDGLDGGAFDKLPDVEMFRELQELQRLMKDLQEAFQFPEVGDGLPGGSDPSVDGIRERVFGDEASVEDILFDRQGPRWNGTGTGVDSFDMNNPEPGGYPSGERGPSGQAAPDITPGADRDSGHGYFSPYVSGEYIITRSWSDGSFAAATESHYSSDGNLIMQIHTGDYVDYLAGGHANSQWIDVYRDGEYLGTVIRVNGETYKRFVRDYVGQQSPLYPAEDSQPNPEGDDDGGPIKGDSNDILDWLAGLSPRSRNPATAPRIGKLDVLGQPDSEEGRYRTAAPNRFARMHDDIDPAMMSSGADGGGTGGDSEGCPIGPDPDDPDSPIGPSGPSPVE